MAWISAWILKILIWLPPDPTSPKRFEKQALVPDSREYRNPGPEASRGSLGRAPVAPAELLVCARANLAA